MNRPVCYTFRRCPYAMRARMAMDAAQIDAEYREIEFRNKPPQMLEVSPKGTVPVLILDDGTVIDESRDILNWALGVNDPENWLPIEPQHRNLSEQLVDTNDQEFKLHLDRYKYADRYPEKTPEQHRAVAEVFLRELETRLEETGFLVSDQLTAADVAIFPFIRQFFMVDAKWFDKAPYPNLKIWLGGFLDSERFKRVMTKRELWAF